MRYQATNVSPNGTHTSWWYVWDTELDRYVSDGVFPYQFSETYAKLHASNLNTRAPNLKGV